MSSKAVSRQEYDDAAAALKQAEAEIQAGKSAVETARINLAHTRVTAPISGRIGRSSVTVGALALAGQGNALTTIQQIDPIYVDVTQSSASLLRLQRSMADGKLKKGGTNRHVSSCFWRTEVPILGRKPSIPRYHGRSYNRLFYPSHCISQSKRVLLPECTFGQSSMKASTNSTPGSAAGGKSRPEGESAGLIVDVAGKVQQRILTVDRTIGNRWLVTTGLASGDRVIVEGAQKVKPGVSVKIVLLLQSITMRPHRCKSELREDMMLSRFFLDRPVFAWSSPSS